MQDPSATPPATYTDADGVQRVSPPDHPSPSLNPPDDLGQTRSDEDVPGVSTPVVGGRQPHVREPYAGEIRTPREDPEAVDIDAAAQAQATAEAAQAEADAQAKAEADAAAQAQAAADAAAEAQLAADTAAQEAAAQQAAQDAAASTEVAGSSAAADDTVAPAAPQEA